MAEVSFNWYDLIKADAPLEQGDLILSVPVFEPDVNNIDLTQPAEDEKAESELTVKKYDLIVMTQSCDFAKLDDNGRVICCMISAYPKAIKQSDWNKEASWTNLRRGQVIALHLLNKCDIEGHAFDYQIVSLRDVITLPLGFIKKIAVTNGERIRLLPPYREHLSQAFARQFMRVGLPIDLPEKDPYKAK